MKTIVFVEDDLFIVQVYRGGLVNAGYNVVVAEDGLAAMKSISELRPDLVLLDVLMPKVEGTYVLKFIRSRTDLQHVKVIVLSNATNADIAHDVLALNPDRVFLKAQCTPKLLLKAIRELLGDEIATA